MSDRLDFAAWLLSRGVEGGPGRGGLVAVRRHAEQDREGSAALLAELDRLHAEYSAEAGLPRVVSVSAGPMHPDAALALAGVVFSGEAS